MRTGAGDHGSTPFTRGIYQCLTVTPQVWAGLPHRDEDADVYKAQVICQEKHR